MSRQASDNEVDAFVAGLSDQQFAECVAAVLEDNKTLNPDGRKVLMKFKARKSRTLKRWVFNAFSPSQPKPNWSVDVAADFEVE